MKKIVIATCVILFFVLGCENSQTNFDSPATVIEKVKYDPLIKEIAALNQEAKDKIGDHLVKIDSLEKEKLDKYIRSELPSKTVLEEKDIAYLSQIFSMKNRSEFNSFFEKRIAAITQILNKYPKIITYYQEDLKFRESFISLFENDFGSDKIQYRAANCCGYTGTNAGIRNCQYIVCLEKDQCRSNAGARAWGYFFTGVGLGAGIVGGATGPPGVLPGAAIGGSAGAIVGLVSWGYDSNDCELIANAKCDGCSNPN